MHDFTLNNFDFYISPHISRYSVATERFMVSDFPSVEAVDRPEYLQTCDIRTYVQFSMRDVIYLTKLSPVHVS